MAGSLLLHLAKAAGLIPRRKSGGVGDSLRFGLADGVPAAGAARTPAKGDGGYEGDGKRPEVRTPAILRLSAREWMRGLGGDNVFTLV